MSFNLGVTCCGGGIGLTIYGGYQYVTASQKPVDKASEQREMGLGFVAAGVLAVAIGAGLICFGESAEPISEPNTSITHSSIATIEEIANCPINALKNILNAGGSDSTTAKVFKVLEDNQGISCENYLPWQDEFHRGGTGYIDGIHAKHLQKSAMWGIDQWNRPYVAIKYVCDQAKEGAVALFQRYTDSGNLMAAGGHFQPQGCFLGPLRPVYSSSKEFLGNLTSMFKGEDVVSRVWDNTCILNLAQ